MSALIPNTTKAPSNGYRFRSLPGDIQKRIFDLANLKSTNFLRRPDLYLDPHITNEFQLNSHLLRVRDDDSVLVFQLFVFTAAIETFFHRERSILIPFFHSAREFEEDDEDEHNTQRVTHDFVKRLVWEKEPPKKQPSKEKSSQKHALKIQSPRRLSSSPSPSGSRISLDQMYADEIVKEYILPIWHKKYDVTFEENDDFHSSVLIGIHPMIISKEQLIYIFKSTSKLDDFFTIYTEWYDRILKGFSMDPIMRVIMDRLRSAKIKTPSLLIDIVKKKIFEIECKYTYICKDSNNVRSLDDVQLLSQDVRCTQNEFTIEFETMYKINVHKPTAKLKLYKTGVIRSNVIKSLKDNPKSLSNYFHLLFGTLLESSDIPSKYTEFLSSFLSHMLSQHNSALEDMKGKFRETWNSGRRKRST